MAASRLGGAHQDSSLGQEALEGKYPKLSLKGELTCTLRYRISCSHWNNSCSSGLERELTFAKKVLGEMVLSQNWNNPRFKERKKNPTKNPHKICAESKYVFSASSYRQKGNTILISIGHHHFSSCMFCLIYYFLPIFLKISLGPSLKHFPSVFHFLQDEVSVSYPLRGGEGEGAERKKSWRKLASE